MLCTIPCTSLFLYCRIPRPSRCTYISMLAGTAPPTGPTPPRSPPGPGSDLYCFCVEHGRFPLLTEIRNAGRDCCCNIMYSLTPVLRQLKPLQLVSRLCAAVRCQHRLIAACSIHPRQGRCSVIWSFCSFAMFCI